MVPDSVAVIVDPFAGGGRGRKSWPAYQRALARHLPGAAVEFVENRGNAAHNLAAAIGSGADLVLAVGDTGTANEAAAAFLASGFDPDDLPAFGLLPVGAGTDFTRSLGMEGSADAIVAQIRNGLDRRIDVVRVSCRDADDRPVVRLVVNTAGLGLSADIAGRADQARLNRMFSSQIVFFIETVRALMRFRFPKARIVVDDGEAIETAIAETVIANGRFYGGGMAIAPDADLTDGQFDVVVIEAQSKIALIDQITRIYNGGHRNMPFVSIRRGRRVRIEAGGDHAPIGLVLDGIPAGRTPMSAEILPAAFKVRVAAACRDRGPVVRQTDVQVG